MGVPDPEIKRLKSEIESLRSQLEKLKSTKENPEKDTIVDKESQEWVRRQENLEIEDVIKKTQDNILDSSSSN
jgi:hypothetical protein